MILIRDEIKPSLKLSMNVKRLSIALKFKTNLIRIGSKIFKK